MNLMKDLYIHETAMVTMKQDAVEIFPDECCGFLFGVDSEMREVMIALPVINSKEGDKKRRFEISPDDYRKAELFAVRENLSLVGIYHSHPLHPAVASEHDRAVAMPWFSYVILSVFGNEVRDIKSWQLDDQRQFREERITSGITPNHP